MGAADLDLTPVTPIPYFPGRESLWLPSSDMGVAQAEVVARLLEQRQTFLVELPGAREVTTIGGYLMFKLARVPERVALTLSGHTHGGQLMLSEQVGFGPLKSDAGL